MLIFDVVYENEYRYLVIETARYGPFLNSVELIDYLLYTFLPTL